jgi:hypothetical protein
MHVWNIIFHQTHKFSFGDFGDESFSDIFLTRALNTLRMSFMEKPYLVMVTVTVMVSVTDSVDIRDFITTSTKCTIPDDIA